MQHHSQTQAVQQHRNAAGPAKLTSGFSVANGSSTTTTPPVQRVSVPSQGPGSMQAAQASGKPIQLRTEIHYRTQNLNYTDPATGAVNAAVVGHRMNAHLDPDDPKQGTGPGALGGANEGLYTALNHYFRGGVVGGPAPGGASPIVKGHLLNDHLGGLGIKDNLFPQTRTSNGAYQSRVENPIKAALVAHHPVEVEVQATKVSPGNIDNPGGAAIAGGGAPAPGASHGQFQATARLLQKVPGIGVTWNKVTIVNETVSSQFNTAAIAPVHTPGTNERLQQETGFDVARTVAGNPRSGGATTAGHGMNVHQKNYPIIGRIPGIGNVLQQGAEQLGERFSRWLHHGVDNNYVDANGDILAYTDQ